MEFRCRLASPSGQIIEGVYSADNETRLRHELEEKGLYVLSLQPKGAVAGLSIRLPQQRRRPSRAVLVFNHQLATLLKAGMPLVQSLDLLKRRVESPRFRAVLEDVHEKVRSGTALSDAFASHGELFPSVYVASLLAGERSGSLDTVLRRYVEYSKVVATLKRKTLSAMSYLAIVVCPAALLVGIIILKVFPAFADFYASFGAELPFVTRTIMSFSEFVRGQLLVILISLAAAVAAVAMWFRNPANKARLDHVLLRLPLIGPVSAKFATSQMARTLATLLGGGLPLVHSLEIAAKAIRHHHTARQLRHL